MNQSESKELKSHILIVDDTLQNLQLMTDMLSKNGYSVTAAPDGPTALMIAGNEPPDLILLDIRMTDMDGYEVCARLKSDAKTHNIPIIFLSALDDLQDKIRGFSLGAADYITKPFQDEEVLARVKNHLNLQNFPKELEAKNFRLQAEITARIKAEESLKIYSDQLETLVIQRTGELMRENSLNACLASVSARFLSSAEYDIAKVADLILKAAMDLSGSFEGYVSDSNPLTKENTVRAFHEISPSRCKLLKHPLNREEPFYTNDVKNHLSSSRFPEEHPRIERFLSVPVLVEEKLSGQIALANSLRNYTDADLDTVKRLSDLYALAIQRCRYEQEKATLTRQLHKAQRLEVLGTLAGGIAHDFNNILFPISGYAEMIRDESPENSTLRTYITYILEGTSRAGELVRQILTFSRQAEQIAQPLKIHLVIKEAFKLIRVSLPSTIQIRQNIQDCGMVRADPTQIHQMTMNLIANAFHAMEEKGGILSIALEPISLSPEDISDPDILPGDYICLTVADTGIGMDATIMEHIFDPYFTTKKLEKGTGLGLAVVHGIVKNCHGEIRVFSEPGRGSEFKIYLPKLKNGESPKQRIKDKEPLPRGTEHILIIDDELPILTMLKNLLESLGYRISTRTDGIKAWEAVRADPESFDLIITDLTMPNMTGIQLAEKILSLCPEIPIVMCSGFGEQKNIEKAKASGIREYLMKPIIKSELAKTIRRVLYERKAK